MSAALARHRDPYSAIGGNIGKLQRGSDVTTADSGPRHGPVLVELGWRRLRVFSPN